jgi:hypothetical protein
LVTRSKSNQMGTCPVGAVDTSHASPGEPGKHPTDKGSAVNVS